MKLLAAYTASKAEKLRVIFSIWAVDGGKRVSRGDHAIVERALNKNAC